MEFISQATVQINETNLISNRTHFDQQVTKFIFKSIFVLFFFYECWNILTSFVAWMSAVYSHSYAEKNGIMTLMAANLKLNLLVIVARCIQRIMEITL